jgi:hypothetical protein
MIEIKDCLPQHAVPHFINLRNVRLERERKLYQQKLGESRAQAAARGVINSGFQQLAEWQLKDTMHEAIATGYVEDFFETCELYDIPLTRPLCERLLQAVGDLLTAQYKSALQAEAQGVSDVRIPLSIRSQMGNSPHFPVMSRIRVMVETARVKNERARVAMTKDKTSETYNMNITQHGGVLNASQTGNVYVQQLTAEQLIAMQPELAALGAALKAQNTLDANADENVGLLASAEKAARAGDEGKMLSILKQVPAKVWDVGKGVISGALVAYLKAHGLIP